MSRIAVNADSLATAEKTLGGLAETLSVVSVDTTQFDDVMGGGMLHVEMGLFNAAWQHAIADVASEIHQLSSHLRQAVEHYEQIDGQVAHRSKGHGGDPRPVTRVATHRGHGHAGGRATSTRTGSGPTSIAAFDPAAPVATEGT